MEYRLIFHFFQDSDFYEGVRALLITKDKHPKWNPPSIEDVPVEQVLSFFEPLPNNDGLPMLVTTYQFSRYSIPKKYQNQNKLLIQFLIISEKKSSELIFKSSTTPKRK